MRGLIFFGLVGLGLFGLARLGLLLAAEAWAAGARGSKPPVGRASGVEPGLLGLAAGGLLALFLLGLGVGGVWPLWACAFGGAAGWGWGVYRAERTRRRREAELMVLLAELALQIRASHQAVEPALRAAAMGDGEARRALRAALARAGDRGAPAVLEAWAAAFRPDLLGPVAAAVRAAAEAGLSPAEALAAAADRTSAELLHRAAGRVRALPDALLPFLGLGVFAPILGLLMVPLLTRIVTQVLAIGLPAVP